VLLSVPLENVVLSDLRNPRLLFLKAGLFLVLGGLAVVILLLEHPRWQVAALVAVAIWACARAYYFAFHGLEHYVDGEYRFAGLLSLARYLWRRRGGG
jgi:hypothetical protein